MNQKSFPLLVGAFLVAASTSVLADTVRLAGSTTVINTVVAPNRAAVERASGHTLEVVGNGSGKGLAELIESKADIGMISDQLDIALASVESLGVKADASKLRTHVMSKGEIVFVIHGGNPVAKLSFAQLSDIHTGKVTNWKQMGGADRPITVYLEQTTGGVRSTVRKQVMGGADYAQGSKTLTSISRVADLVAGDEGGIGAISKAFVKADGRNRIIDAPRIDQPLTFVTLGEPSGKVKAVLEAFAATR